jgi:hypothetical protein
VPTEIASKVSSVSPVEIEKLVLGVRYEPQWGLTDRLGAVIDAVLRQTGSPFDLDRFPVSQRSRSEHRLVNEGDESLRINQQDTILEVRLGTRDLRAAQQIATDFDSFVLRPLREIAKLKMVHRLGLVLQTVDVRGAVAKSPISKYIGPEFPNVTEMAMRFVRRIAAEEALVKKGVQDYRKVLYLMREQEDGRVTFSIDNQYYYEPALDGAEWDKRQPFEAFSARAIAECQTELGKWLKPSEMVDVA